MTNLQIFNTKFEWEQYGKNTNKVYEEVFNT